MNEVERRRRVDELCDAALDREPDERAAFVVAACAGDAALQQEVESLLAHHRTAGGFLAQSARASLAAQMVRSAAPTLVGRTIGVYHLESLLGAGGMGQVYRAHDGKLGRDVAIKILPPHFTNDPERLARFEREARMLATLNDPHIGAIYGLEEDGDVRALVLELVEGETLADRIARGPIPLDDALPIARQIAEGLEAAHSKGIVHRDLKPANVKITLDGIAKVLDFGIAKASFEAPEADPTRATTVVVDGTRAGAVLGTPSYMSPEQARGQAVDKRTDMWSFGCLLYEMLTGKRAFDHDGADVFAGVLKTEADWSGLPPDTPLAIRRLLRRCLTKDPKRRVGDASIARIEIDEAPSEFSPAPPLASSRQRLFLVSALAFTAVTAAAALFWASRPAPASAEIRLEIIAPATTDPLSLAVAPDRRKLVFTAQVDGRPKLLLRQLDSTTIQPIAGTDGAAFPFWSPDSRTVGFFAEGKLKRVDVAGGTPQVLADAPTGRGGTWNAAGDIVFAPTSFPGPLYRVPATGGESVSLAPADGPLIQRFPHFLPDGRHFLFYAPAGDARARAIYLGSLDSFKPRRLLDADAAAVFLPPQHIIFIRQGRLFAQRFDLTALQVMGDPQLLAENVAADPTRFSAGLSAVADTVAYSTQPAAGPRQLRWFDRAGRLLATVGETDVEEPLNPELSPDGTRVVVDRMIGGNRDIWILNSTNGLRTRFTSDTATDYHPIWSPDGRSIVFSSFRTPVATALAQAQLYRKASSGAGADELFVESSQVKLATDWSRDGRFILVNSVDPKGAYDVWALALSKDHQLLPIANTSFEERDGQFSPDGRWVAYTSNVSGRFEVYVQTFPGPGEKLLVSPNGGGQPRWRKDGKELFYVAPDNRLMVVPVILSTKERADLGTASTLFVAPLASEVVPGGNKQQYAVSSDGQRFLMNVATEDRPVTPITLILHWKPPL
jgi:serine/threonine protein kinase/Tol biopolymer transport system component